MLSVIFDMDGTLLDTQRVYIPAWEEVGAKFGIENLGEHIPACCGRSDADWKAYLLNLYPFIDIDAFTKDVKAYVIKNLVVRFKKGAPELMAFLKEKGIKVALASGSPHNIISHHLKEVGAENYFDVIVSGDDVEHGKPAPDVFLLTAEKLGVDPKSCIVIEDSENGINAGLAAGMTCIGIPDVAVFSDDIVKKMHAKPESLLDVISIIENMI